MPIVSYAQNFEDVLLQRVFRDISEGFYVDVGANDPVRESVTKAFYDLGWRGINLEPVPKYWRMLESARPRDTNLAVVIGDHSGDTHFYEVAGTGLSCTDESQALSVSRSLGFECKVHRLRQMTLTDVLASCEVGAIHFLKIDVEGAESAVLRGLDLCRFRPWVILLEANEQLSRVQNHEAWEPMLLEREYEFVYADGLNRFYLASEHSERKSSFDFPPNVFDDIVPGNLLDLYTQVCDEKSGIALRPAFQIYDELSQKIDGLINARAEAEHLRATVSEREHQLEQIRADVDVLRDEIAGLKGRLAWKIQSWLESTLSRLFAPPHRQAASPR